MDRLIEILEKLNIPYAYDHFAEGESRQLPFICYKLPKSENFSADGKAYHKKSVVSIELYTEKKDLKIENEVETVLDEYGYFYNKSETWIDREKMYEVLFSFEI